MPIGRETPEQLAAYSHAPPVPIASGGASGVSWPTEEPPIYGNESWSEEPLRLRARACEVTA